MAQRDYVKKKAKAKSSSRIIPNLMMAIAVLLVILFAAILYFVSTNKPSKPITAPLNVTEKPQIALPDKPEERWTYLKELENPNGNNPISIPHTIQSTQDKERQQILNSFINDKQTTPTTSNPVQKEATQQAITPQNTAAQTGNWSLQCGAFKDKANAESLQAKLAMFGMASFIKSEKFHRVFVGPYKLKLDAENAIKTLKNNGITSCIITSK